MRFAAVVALAGAAVAHRGAEPESTHYETQYFTVTKCDATVTNCPASSTQVTSTIIPVTTSDSLPVVETPEPIFSELPSHSVPSAPHGGNFTAPPAGVTPEPSLTPVITSSALPFAETPAECAGQSIETISTYIVTTISTVSYITHAAPCETDVPGVPSVPVTTPKVPTNGTTPTPSVPIPTGAASSIGASFALAAVAGAIALFA
jgi:hypothetical protein